MVYLEELSVWQCAYCDAKNDHTNASRCWNCNKKKPTYKTFKRITNKRKKEKTKKEEEAKRDIISKIDTLPAEAAKEYKYDVSKLIVDS